MSETTNGLTLVSDSLPTIERIILLNAPEGLSPEKIKAIAAEELSHLQAIAMTKPDIMLCEPISVLLAVKQAMRKNLTLDPSAGLVYVRTRNIKTKDGWAKILEIQDTANGMLSVARQCGRVLDHKYPVCSYNKDGKVIQVSFSFLVQSVPAPRWETVSFGTDSFERWRVASHKENSRSWQQSSGKPQPDLTKLNYANPNYTSWKGGIDPAFAGTKAVRHALKKQGTNYNERNAVKIMIDPKSVQVAPIETIYEEVKDENQGPILEAENQNEPPVVETPISKITITNLPI
jgi:hypothetical protein